MYPSHFQYEAPTSLEDALDLLSNAEGEAKVVAGGMSLIPMIKLRFATPDLLVDINNIPDLDYHREDGDGTLHIGALCRHSELERSDLLRRTQPTMAAAAPLIADPLVRNRGTLVGSVCHADPQGDWQSVLMALAGEIVAVSAEGERAIPVTEFVVGPFQNALKGTEIAIEARVPPPQGTRAGGYLKLERRVGDFATVGVAVALDMSGSTVNRAGIALTGVGSANIHAEAAEQAIVGNTLSSGAIEEAARQAAQASEPNSDHRGSAEYKRHIVYTFVKRLLSNRESARAA